MKFLINRTDAIGDTLLTFPLAQIIKDHFPQAKVYFLVVPRVLPLCALVPSIDQSWAMPEKGKFTFLRQLFLENGITHYLYLGGSHWPSAISFLLRTPFRGGTLSRWPSFLWLNHAVRQIRSEVKNHEAQYNTAVLAPLIPSSPLPLSSVSRPSPMVLSESQEQAGRKILVQIIQDSLKNSSTISSSIAFIAIHPGMTGHSLNWPTEQYAELILQLLELLPPFVFIFVTYTQGDQKYISPLKSQLSSVQNSRLIFLDGGQLGLQNFAFWLSSCSLFLGPSTGTTHLANALGIPTLAFYSPIKVQSAARWRPYFSLPMRRSQLSYEFTPTVPCPAIKQCLGEACSYHPCMKLIAVKDVVSKVLQITGEGEDQKNSKEKFWQWVNPKATTKS
jgi:heptosyltransferase-3